jgi:MoxR-like ATPase
VSDFAKVAEAIMNNVEKVVIGKRPAIKLFLAGLLTDGHILIEDVPGVAKTMMARALAKSLGCSFNRIQCTPDLLPTDVTGVSIFNQKTREFEFRPGPIFSQFVLADEINRATPRTQSALLEAMAEGFVTVDGITHVLKKPFMVIATQNPIEHEGTFPLPEAQLDRFLLKMSVGYPAPDSEYKMLEAQRVKHPIDEIGQVIDADVFRKMQDMVKNVFVHEKVRRYLIELVNATRRDIHLALGGSPRASLSLFRTSQALAVLSGRTYVIPDDIKALAHSVLDHRVILKPESKLRRMNAHKVIDEMLKEVKVPMDVYSWDKK